MIHRRHQNRDGGETEGGEGACNTREELCTEEEEVACKQREELCTEEEVVG
jgi:hypothetical protein